MIRRPPRSTLFPTRRSSDLVANDQRSVFDGRTGKREDLCMRDRVDRKSTRLNSSHGYISYAVFCLKKKQQVQVDVPEQSHTTVVSPTRHCACLLTRWNCTA